MLVIFLFIHLASCVYVSPSGLCVPGRQSPCLFYPCLIDSRCSISIDQLERILGDMQASLSLANVQDGRIMWLADQSTIPGFSSPYCLGGPSGAPCWKMCRFPLQ